MKPLNLTVLLTALLFSAVHARAATLSETPANMAQGGSVSVSWSVISFPTNRDWIGLYLKGAGDGSYQYWIYLSCSQTPTSPLASGSCPFPIPTSVANGTYELRLFSNDGFTRLATSNPFNVAPPTQRFVDNGNGTITDLQTGLMWEKKTECTGSSSTNIHCAENAYIWTSTGSGPDGTLFSDFLARMNAVFSSSLDGSTIVDVCFAGYCDWRIPSIAELRSIVLTCPNGEQNCIDPLFGPTGDIFAYWSSTTYAQPPGNIFVKGFAMGYYDLPFAIPKTDPAHARGVRR